MQEKLLTANEVAEMLNIKKASVYQYVYLKRIPAVKISKRCVRFRKTDFLNWLDKKYYPAKKGGDD